MVVGGFALEQSQATPRAEDGIHPPAPPPVLYRHLETMAELADWVICFYDMQGSGLGQADWFENL